MANEPQNQVERKSRVPLESRIVVLRDGSEIKFSDLHPQRQGVLHRLDQKLPRLESTFYPIEYPGCLNSNARINLGAEIDIPDMYHKLLEEMKDENGLELMKSFFAGDIYGRCDDQGRIIFRSGKFRHFMSLGFALNFPDSSEAQIDYGRNLDFHVCNTSVCGHYDLCPQKTCESSEPNRFGSFDVRHYCNIHNRRIDGDEYRVNSPDGSIRWSSLKPGVMHLIDNYDIEETIVDPKRVDSLRENVRKMLAIADRRSLSSDFPSLADMWAYKET